MTSFERPLVDMTSARHSGLLVTVLVKARTTKTAVHHLTVRGPTFSVYAHDRIHNLKVAIKGKRKRECDLILL